MKKELNSWKMSKIQPDIYKIFLVLIILIFFTSELTAEIKKPNPDIKPREVIEIQLNALMKNDIPSKDNGIIQTWFFAHPNNQRVTGPIERFKYMIKSDSYSMLLNHKSYEILEVYKSKGISTFEVTILDKDKKYYKFKWQVEKYEVDGFLKNCWLTTAVSQPMPMGSSI
tara:strand:+ start:34 stop:543 length:510 start_codon:yes stop_codon:yes gene_type:complete